MATKTNVTPVAPRQTLKQVAERRRQLLADIEDQKRICALYDRDLGGAALRSDERAVQRAVKGKDDCDRQMHLFRAALAALDNVERQARAGEIRAARQAHNDALAKLHEQVALDLREWTACCEAMPKIATRVETRVKEMRAVGLKQELGYDAMYELLKIMDAMVDELIVAMLPPDTVLRGGDEEDPGRSLGAADIERDFVGEEEFSRRLGAEESKRDYFKNKIRDVPMYQAKLEFLAKRTPTHLLDRSLVAMTVAVSGADDETPPEAA